MEVGWLPKHINEDVRHLALAGAFTCSRLIYFAWKFPDIYGKAFGCCDLLDCIFNFSKHVANHCGRYRVTRIINIKNQ